MCVKPPLVECCGGNLISYYRLSDDLTLRIEDRATGSRRSAIGTFDAVQSRASNGGYLLPDRPFSFGNIRIGHRQMLALELSSLMAHLILRSTTTRIRPRQPPEVTACWVCPARLAEYGSRAAREHFPTRAQLRPVPASGRAPPALPATSNVNDRCRGTSQRRTSPCHKSCPESEISSTVEPTARSDRMFLQYFFSASVLVSAAHNRGRCGNMDDVGDVAIGHHVFSVRGTFLIAFA